MIIYSLHISCFFPRVLEAREGMERENLGPPKKEIILGGVRKERKKTFLGVFGKMSAVHCRCFFPSSPLPSFFFLCFFCASCALHVLGKETIAQARLFTIDSVDS